MARILIVEDESNLAQGLLFNLKAEGHEVRVEAEGESALETLRREPFDAVVLDVMLPGKDGFEIASNLRADGNYIPILMLTARSRSEDILKGFAAGADDYLPKPFELSVLLARLNGAPAPHAMAASAAPRTDTAPGEAADIRLCRNAHPLRRPGTARPRPHLPPNPDGGRPAALSHPPRGRIVSRKSCWSRSGACTRTPTPAPSTISSCGCAATSRTIPPRPRHLLTVRGVGYRFMPNPD